MKSKMFNRVISANLNGLFMKRISKEKGWTKEQARKHLIDFAACGELISIKDFMESR